MKGTDLLEAYKDKIQVRDNCLGKRTETPEHEIILLVGSPGSGKSVFAKKWLPYYVRINNIMHKTMAKSKKVCR